MDKIQNQIRKLSIYIVFAVVGMIAAIAFLIYLIM